jgi:RNA polymerase sigma factor (sigma-70 family)
MVWVHNRLSERAPPVSTDSLADDLSARHLLNEANDEALVAAAKAGERLAFVEICNRHSKRIFHAICRITRNQEDAEDARQEAFLKAFVNLKNFDGRSKFSTWLTRIAINSALMILRKKRANSEISIDSYIDDGTLQHWEIPDQTIDIELHYVRYERENHLRRAIHRLKPALRDVVEIQQLHDGSIKEIAQVAGISVAATKSRLLRARVALRGSLNNNNTSNPHR